MKKFIKIIFTLLVAAVIIGNCDAAVTEVNASGETLYVGGITAGFTIKPVGATVIGLSDIITDEGIFSPAKNADIQVGDTILQIGGRSVNGAIGIYNALKASDGSPTEVVISRRGEEIKKYISPKKDKTGYYKLGVLIRDDLNGIGTITYFTENGKFVALGHPILNDNGEIINVSGGKAYLCSVIGVNKGERGKAGELKGVFIEDETIGDITSDKESGLYGTVGQGYDYKSREKMEAGEAQIGSATIIACVDGTTPKEYQINIVKVEKNDPENKDMVIKVTDDDLLKVTNGIVQGMSGSPIIQNGKIVGAVTHVFINDSTRGFGISIEKMLEN
ncbi:MAG: SpoIVB peptidase [Clostridia bacterium]|nr:SpoIVB peptidase [Clostridia bacterium]